jgi:TonB-dependent receptor
MKNHWMAFLAGLVFLLSSLASSAQNNSVNGLVFDKVSNETLVGASIRILGTQSGTMTNNEGIFSLSGIKNSKIRIVVSFLGYTNDTISCDFSTKNKLHKEIGLELSSTFLETYEVKDRAEGQVKALIRQKTALNIKNIVSTEQIKQFPDMNAAEVLQRIPGITIQRDQGEGRYVQLRGTSPEYTTFNINGEQIPSPEGGVRYVGMDIISADQIETIEVTKVLTPDMDADGIGGSVNIITKTADDSIPKISASMATGYNNLMGTSNNQLQFSYGQRVGKVGIQMSASYYNNNQGSHNMEYDYTRGPVLSQASDTTAENFHILYKNIELRHYTIQRERIGVNLNLDYKPKPGHTFYARGMYNRFSDDEQRRRLSYDVTDANTLLIYREAGISRDLRDREKIQSISTLNAGAEHHFKGAIILDYELSASHAVEEVPDGMYVKFDNGGITLEVDRSDSEWPIITFPYEDDSLDAFTYENYEFDEINFYQNYVVDDNYTGKINLQLPYAKAKHKEGFIKFGTKFRIKEKTRQNEARSFNKYYEKLSIYSQTGPELNLTTIMDGFNETNLLNHNYLLSSMIGSDEIRSFFEKHPQHFKYDEAETWEETYSEDFSASEHIYAGYVMVKQNFGKLMLLSGLRYEQTEVRNQGLKAGIDYTSGGTLYVDTTNDSRIHRFWLPQIQMRYALTPKTNLRAALTYTYSRPNFDDVIPYRQDDDNDIEIGNPDLKYPLSMNVDLLAETYLKNAGIISGGLFYKQIDNVIFKFVRNAHEGTNFNLYGLREITMAVNGQNANVYGAEITAQFKFNFFDNFFKDFGIFSNYTFTESEAFISKRYPQNENDVIFIFDEDDASFFTMDGETEKITLPGQAKHNLNFAIFYENKKFFIRLASNYHSAFLSSLGNDAGLDVYYNEAFRLDFTSNYQITETINIFLDVINLTNTPLRYYMGSEEYFKQQEYYSWWGRFGVKININ